MIKVSINNKTNTTSNSKFYLPINLMQIMGPKLTITATNLSSASRQISIGLLKE